MGFLSLSRTKKESTSALPQTYTFSSDSLTVTTMSTTSYSTNGSRPTSRHYDTGFPDTFAARTTSMRHPDAVIDPSFSISAEHIDPAKTMHRSRRSLLRKHRRTISYGKISNEESFGPDYTETSASRPSTTDGAADFLDQKSRDLSAGMAQPSETGAENQGQGQESDNILGLSASFQYAHDGDDGEERRRSNIFRKLLNKN